MSVVETPQGPVRGKSPQPGSARGVPLANKERTQCLEFLGIRYARAPVGPLRFRPPEPVPAWTEPYDATAFGPSAPQPQMTGDDAALQMPVEPTDEDCLFLNIYTPATDDGKRPVMFWIHGGGYVAGSGRAYHGGVLARDHDVVVVTINYRMGALGFMHVGHLDRGLDESVNNGILDQIAALEWTRDNIRAFGGDPDNVMIFGESAGGTSTAMLLGCPRAEGLFHKACVHSPHVDLIPVGDGHIAFTNRCMERLGGDPQTNGLATLMGASTDELVALSNPDPDVVPQPNLAFRRADSVSFSPAIDGTLIPRPVADTIRHRGPANVPFLGGGCRHEGTLFAAIVGGECSEDEARALFDRRRRRRPRHDRLRAVRARRHTARETGLRVDRHHVPQFHGAHPGRRRGVGRDLLVMDVHLRERRLRRRPAGHPRHRVAVSLGVRGTGSARLRRLQCAGRLRPRDARVLGELRAYG